MTTIAYKDGVIAYDSRVTQGSVIMSDNDSKCYLREGQRFFCTGDHGGIEKMIDYYLMGLTKLDQSVDGSAFVVTEDGGLCLIGVTSDRELWCHRMQREAVYAIGSGSHFAIAFMDAGMTAVDAVKMTAKRDIYTGGKIRSYDLSQLEIADDNNINQD